MQYALTIVFADGDVITEKYAHWYEATSILTRFLAYPDHLVITASITFIA